MVTLPIANKRSNRKSLVEDYIRLSQTFHLSDEEAARMAEILELAIFDNSLHCLLREADQILDENSSRVDQEYYLRQKSKLIKSMNDIDKMLGLTKE
jgi:hypothetical protein